MISIALTAIALLLSLSLQSLLSQTMGAFFYIAIILSTWYGGFRSGLIAVILATLAIDYFFIPPLNQVGIAQPESLLQLGIFLVVALIINIFSSSLLNNQEKINSLSQELIQKSIEPLRIALAAAETGMWQWDLETGKFYFSPDHEELFGLLPGTFDSQYETFLTYLHPDDKELVQQALQQAITNKKFYQQEYRVVWKDGSIHWIEGKGHAFYNEAGKPILMTGTVTAIDDRKQAQALLEQQFEQQRLVMEINQRIPTTLNLSEILQITVDEIRRILKTDRVIILQFSPQWRGTVVVESVGAEWTAILSTDIYDPCFSKKYIELYKKGLITAKSDIYSDEIDPCHLELLINFQVKANLVVPIIEQNDLWGLLIAHHCEAPRQWQATEIELMRQIAAQVSIAIQHTKLFAQLQSELEERKQIEANLRQSEVRYRSLVNASTQIIWNTNAEGKATIAPDNWEEMTGQSPEECLGWGWLMLIHPDDRTRTIQHWLECCQTHTIYEIEYRLRMKDGNYRLCSVRGVPIFAADGTVIEWIGSCNDITESKQAEVALQQINAELEARVVERTTELMEVNDRLQGGLILRARLQRELREREQLLDSFFNAASAANIGLAIHDRQLNYLKVNQALADINGASINTLLGKNLLETLPELASKIIPALQRVVDTGQAIRRLEITGTTPSQPKSLQYWLVSNFPIFGDNQEVIAVGSIVLDITERKRIEETLKQTYQQLTFHIENTPLATIIWDSEFRVKQWSKQAEQIFGWSAAEVLGKTMYDWQFIFADDLELVKSAAQLLLQGNTIQCNNRNYRKDGQVIDCEWYNSVLLDKSGNLVSMLSLAQDVSDRKKTEIALRESEAKFRQLAENIQAVFWMKDTQTQKIVYLSNAYQTIWQRSCESVYENRLNWLETVHPKDRQRVETVFDEIKTEEPFEIEYRIIRPDGSVRWINDRAFPILNEAGEIIRVAGIAEDITARKQAEKALRDSEEKFRQLTENIQALFWITDYQTQKIIYASHAYEKIWQRSRESVYQNFWSWFEAIHPNDISLVEAAIKQQRETGKSDTIYRIIRPDGSLRWIRDRAFPILNESGEIIRIAGIAEDITEQQQIEQIKNEFIGIVSHELRTPLTAIQMSLGLLQTGVYNNNPEKFQRMLNIALLDTNRLVNLVNDILDLERLEAGRATLEKTICQAADLMQQAVNGMEALATSEQITLEINDSDALVWAAKDAIVQTLTNLISNAIKFSPPNSTITLNAEAQTDMVLFQVRDRGRGIPADKLDIIFGRFQQVDASDSREKGGTGLGLAICQSIIQQHGGEIWVESTLGKGSTFFFTLPKEAEPQGDSYIASD
ncbi:hypothetical protein NIES2119_15595 [[Phormidium ambiguum] IAM M-71]|uniref:histidine kinase n=2 Tax=[Phormidium ambiguum] IAM M-71 TaxID=454136 RepID=A0A1U7II55_9CYAN|nr:hypothetical protein NIES2119_15595 [Phormidium ambiguum IAM M-71]